MGRGWRGCMVLGRGVLARAGEAQEGGGLGGPRECWAAGRIRKDWFLLFSFFISFLFLYLLFFYILSAIPIEFLIKRMLHKITHSAK
jgi:hypothetical protein